MEKTADGFLLQIKDVTSASKEFLKYSSVANSDRLSNAVKVLSGSARDPVLTAHLLPDSPAVASLLQNSRALLGHTQSGVVLRSRLYVLLYQLTYRSPRVRRCAALQADFCPIVYQQLQWIREQGLGPQNLIDVLRLLQLLTYDTKFAVGKWTYALLDFIREQISLTVEPEWLPYCVALLCNLIARSKTVTSTFVSTFDDKFAQRFLDLLAHDSRLVVISALSVMGRLGTSLSNKFFTPDNMYQTLLCGFNILHQADLLLTVHYAADFLKAVLLDIRSGAAEPQLSELCRDFGTFPFFTDAIQNTAAVLLDFDACSEELAKSLDLLWSLASVSTIRSHVCQALLATKPDSHKTPGLTTPFKALVRTGALGLDKQPNGRVTIQSIQMLTLLVREVLDDSGDLSKYENPAVLVATVEMNAHIKPDPNIDEFSVQCQLLIETLKLAQALANEREASDMLADALNAPLCSQITDQQLAGNYQIVKACQPNGGLATVRDRTISDALAIPIEMLRLLAILKDHSRIHKELYWRSLEDDRLLPFLAYALCRGSYAQVASALAVIPQCAQNQAFRWSRLAELTAQCAASVPQQLPYGSSGSIPANLSNESVSVELLEAELRKRELRERNEKLEEDVDTLNGRLEEKEAQLRERDTRFDKLNEKNRATEEKLTKAMDMIEQLQSVQKQVASLITKTTDLNLNSAGYRNGI